MPVGVDGPPPGAPPPMARLIFHCLLEQRRCFYLCGLAMRRT
ncbi:uncharacterized protein J3R85_006822 [Psidium guajava]|nr:uncharacterized protein J3R85_006822 [Psidium guajava]